MMISPSESDRRGVAESPMRLLGGGETRQISRLEFHTPERLTKPAVVEAESPGPLLNEELALLEARLRSQNEEMRATIEQVRSEANAEARGEWEKELEEKIAQERMQVVKACSEFDRDRARYFSGIEAEVV